MRTDETGTIKNIATRGHTVECMPPLRHSIVNGSKQWPTLAPNFKRHLPKFILLVSGESMCSAKFQKVSEPLCQQTDIAKTELKSRCTNV